MNPNTTIVLVIEHDLRALAVIGKMLKACECSAVGAVTPQEALYTFAEHHADISLVIANARAPQMHGLQLLQRLRAINPRVPVVLVTASSDVSVTRHQPLGVAGVLRRPFTVGDLALLVRQAVNPASVPRAYRAARTNGNGPDRPAPPPSLSAGGGNGLPAATIQLLEGVYDQPVYDEDEVDAPAAVPAAAGPPPPPQGNRSALHTISSLRAMVSDTPRRGRRSNRRRLARRLRMAVAAAMTATAMTTWFEWRGASQSLPPEQPLVAVPFAALIGTIGPMAAVSAKRPPRPL